jgi:hypothetical protein
MPDISRTLATQYLRLAIWHPHERELTALALRAACDAGISCSAILEDLWPRLHARLEDGRAIELAENLAHYGEFAAVAFLLKQRWRQLSWYPRLQLLRRYATSQFKRQMINDVNRHSAVEHMVQRLCDSASLHVRSAIEIVLQEFAAQSAEALAAAFSEADPDARVRIIRLLAPLMEMQHVESSAPVTLQGQLRQIIRGATRDPQSELRAAAINALQHWRIAEACSELMDLLRDPDLDIAHTASDALINLALLSSEGDGLTFALLQLEFLETPGHIDLVLRTVCGIGRREVVRKALDAGTVRASLHGRVVKLLENWVHPEPSHAIRLESLLLENRASGGAHCSICASKAARDPREWLCR